MLGRVFRVLAAWKYVARRANVSSCSGAAIEAPYRRFRVLVDKLYSRGLKRVSEALRAISGNVPFSWAPLASLVTIIASDFRQCKPMQLCMYTKFGAGICWFCILVGALLCVTV